MRLIRTLNIIICLLVASFVVSGQQILFRSFSVAEGLPSSMVTAITQDKQGYLWFGTRNGLSRFDGYTFKTFQHRKDDPKSLGNNFVYSITHFDSTQMWIGTAEGVFILDLPTETFRRLEYAKGQAVYGMLRDKKGHMWIGTRLNGVYRYDPEKKTAIHFVNRDAGNSISSNEISKLVEADNGRIWIGTYGSGINVFDPHSGLFTCFKAGEKGLTSNFIYTLYKGLDGTIWIGTISGGLCQWKEDKQEFKTYQSGGAFSIRDDIIRCISQPTPGKLHVGTERGLNILDLATDQFTAYTHQINDPFSISDNAVYAIYPDRSGIIWCGTWFGGISYFSEHRNGFELYYPEDKADGLQGRAVSCFLEDPDKKIWVGTEDGGLFHFDPEQRNFRKYPFRSGQEKLAYHNVHSLSRDSKGNIWIGLFAAGLNVLNPSTGKITHYVHKPHDSNSLRSNMVFFIYHDREDNALVGTSRGVTRFDAVTGKPERISHPAMDNTMVYDMYEDNNRTIWFATYENGLVWLNKRNGQWSTLVAGSDEHSLSSNKIISLHDDLSGNIWLGTDGGGLNRYNIKSKKVQVFNGKSGINANVIYDIGEDEHGQLWLTTNNGIYSFNPQTGKAKHFTKQDNLQGHQFNYNALYKTSEGKFLAGGIHGFNMFDPGQVTESAPAARLAFTNFQLFNRDVTPGNEDSPLAMNIGYTKKITLSHDQSVFGFEFAALNSSTPEKVRYAYKMDGFDPDWNYVGGQRKATYTNLAPGTYIFRVKATTDESIWDVPEAKMTVIIRPPFYRTTVAYILYILGAIGLAIGIYRYTINQLKRQNAIRLERLKNKEEKEFYARKIEFFTVMAHEIRTPLSLIIAPLEKLLSLDKWTKEEKEQLRVMDENADRLLNLVNQLLDFRRIESDAYEIKKEQVEIVSLVQSVYSRFSSLRYQGDIEFVMSTHISRLELQADPEVIDKILSNLLINAFKFARKKVRLTIHELRHPDEEEARLGISVEDDGIGISSNDIKNIFKKFFTRTSGSHQYHNLGSSGIGLALASSLTEKHGGNLLVESKEGVRTIFTLELPLSKEKPVASEEETPAILPAEESVNEGPLILVVEDDEGIRLFLEKSFASEGYRVEKAANGKEAIQLLDRIEADLILSDIMMPEMDGLTLCQTIKSNIDHSHIPFVLLTAKGNTETEIKGIESGADGYVMKPFKWKHLIAVIRNLLDSRELLRQKFSEQPNSDVAVLTTNSRDSEFMDRVVGIIRERIMDPMLSVEELSREMAMSRSTLHKKLKSLSGYVPNELIKLIRLKQAAALLQTSDQSMSEIAYLTGFSSPSYFSKCFLQQFGLSPKEYASARTQEKDHDIRKMISKES